MPDLRVLGATSNIIRLVLKNATTGQGKQGVSNSTTGLVVSATADNEATATFYSGSNLEAVTTLGTYAAPTSGKCRIKKVDDTAHPGLVEIQLADARFAVTSAKRLVISVNDAQSTLLDADYEIEFNAPVDVAKINAVSTSSVTTVNANLGTTEPVNFTGTAGSALVKGDAVDIAGTAVPATAGVLDVRLADAVDHGGTAATLRLGGSTSTPALYVTNSGGDAVKCQSTGGGGRGMALAGEGSGSGLTVDSGSSSSAVGMKIFSNAPNFGTGLLIQANGNALAVVGAAGSGFNGTGIYVYAEGGGSALFLDGSDHGPTVLVSGPYNSGPAVRVETISGDAVQLLPTAGHGLKVTANGTDKHGLLVTGGTGGTSDGAKFVAGTGGVDVRGNVTGDVTGNLSGTVGGLTAAGLATLFTTDSTKLYADAVTGSPVKEIASHAAATDVSALALQSTALAVKAQTDLLPSDPADESLVIAATDAIYARLGAPAGASLAADVAGVLTRVLTESYASDGATFTAAQALYMIWSLLAERNVSGTTVTCKKLDGSTSSLVLTLNSATQPTAQTRSG